MVSYARQAVQVVVTELIIRGTGPVVKNLTVDIVFI